MVLRERGQTMGGLRYQKKILLFIIPALFLYILFFIYPFFQTVFYSFTNWDGFTGASLVGVKNFGQILGDEVYRTAVGRIFIWAGLSILLKVGSALVIAYVLRKGGKGASFFRTVVFLPYVISSSAMCLMFSVMYDKEIGLINILLRAIGLDSVTRYWLVDEKTVFYAVILIPIYQAIGYFFVILFAAMKDVPEDLYEAGRLDGTTPLTEFTRITIPYIWPTLVVCIVLAINGAFQNFDYIFIMTGGGPGHASEVPATYMYKSIFVNGQYGYGSAAALILFVITLVVTGFARKGLNHMYRTE